MKIGFFGTPLLSSRMFQVLQEEHDIAFVVTAPDKPRGRHRRVSPSPVKEAALLKGLPVLQPDNPRSPDFLTAIKEFDADIYVVVAYGSIIPCGVYDYPPLKTINLHPSLLPKYRGAAPMQWALINGETETGITVQQINERMDAGDIILQEHISLPVEMTAAELEEIVTAQGPALINRAITILADKGAPRPQDESAATYCKKIDHETAQINWGLSAEEIHNRIRGLNPKPVAVASFKEIPVKIWRSAPFTGPLPGPLAPGEILKFQKKRLIAGTGAGALEILSIQPANKRAMDGASFLNGYRAASGDFFESA